ncbi:hypothetical protein MKX08_007536 [Trichoderma sp. CBMAI-0020]|nr:hypothetical protein MKX08_007536 [Trichoderma sp. CBMAI-0020]
MLMPVSRLYSRRAMKTSALSYVQIEIFIFLTEDICMVNLNTGLRGIKNMAFEYDSSWCDDLMVVSYPEDFGAYFEEKSPRGLFIRFFIESKAWGYRDDSIWLIMA